MKIINESRVFGPPGTGKTTYLTRQIDQALNKFKPTEILVASFTNTAAKELAGRNKNLGRSIGTLHSHCYRAIGSPKLVDKESLAIFNRENPAFRISGEAFNVAIEDKQVEAFTSATMGDYLLHEAQVMRARLIPRGMWRRNVQMFDHRWELFKQSRYRIDFTDMIEMAIDQTETALEAPKVGFFDEAQDFTPLEFKLIRKWAESMEHIILSGDDDQLLYSWIGATPESLIDGEAMNVRVLSQSYRVPKVVQAYAQTWIRQVSKRQEKEYLARDFEGELLKQKIQLSNPSQIIKQIEKDIANDKSVMVLATCGYMLDPLIKAMRAEGMPFHNPYRLSNGKWNPIRLDGTFGAIGDYLRPSPEASSDPRIYDIYELANWIKNIKSKDILKRGAKKLISDLVKDQDMIKFYGSRSGASAVDIKLLYDIFENPDSFISNSKVDMLRWYSENLLQSKKKVHELPLQLYRTLPIIDKQLDIKVKIGTIHSVKGGEADVVYLFPDLSKSAMQESLKSGIGRDSIIRTFYVGMTRAREKLVLCDSDNKYRTRWL